MVLPGSFCDFLSVEDALLERLLFCGVVTVASDDAVHVGETLRIRRFFGGGTRRSLDVVRYMDDARLPDGVLDTVSANDEGDGDGRLFEASTGVTSVGLESAVCFF